MKKSKKLVATTASLMLLATGPLLTACGQNNHEPEPEPEQPGENQQTTEHTHTSTQWKTDATHHWHECTTEGCSDFVYDKAQHTFGDWGEPDTTGTSRRACSVCEYAETKHVHQPVAVAAKAPTCTEDGYIAHYKCSHCDQLFTDAAGTQTTTAAAVKVAAQHTLGDPVEQSNGTYQQACSKCDHVVTHAAVTAWSQDEQKHWHACDVAGCTAHKFAENEHDFDTGVVDGENTVYTCQTCGYQKTETTTNVEDEHATELAALKNAYAALENYRGSVTYESDGTKDSYDAINHVWYHVYENDEDPSNNHTDKIIKVDDKLVYFYNIHDVNCVPTLVDTNFARKQHYGPYGHNHFMTSSAELIAAAETTADLEATMVTTYSAVANMYGGEISNPQAVYNIAADGTITIHYSVDMSIDMGTGTPITMEMSVGYTIKDNKMVSQTQSMFGDDTTMTYAFDQAGYDAINIDTSALDVNELSYAFVAVPVTMNGVVIENRNPFFIHDGADYEYTKDDKGDLILSDNKPIKVYFNGRNTGCSLQLNTKLSDNLTQLAAFSSNYGTNQEYIKHITFTWYLDAACTQPITAETTTLVTSDLALYCKVAPKAGYAVVLETNEYTSGTDSMAFEVLGELNDMRMYVIDLSQTSAHTFNPGLIIGFDINEGVVDYESPVFAYDQITINGTAITDASDLNITLANQTYVINRQLAITEEVEATVMEFLAASGWGF